MKTFRILTVSIFILSSASYADMGELIPDVWKDFPEYSGSLFSVSGTTRATGVELRKELLHFGGIRRDGSALWYAWFDFYNGTGKDISIDTGFPVVFATPFSFNDRGEIVWSDEAELSSVKTSISYPSRFRIRDDNYFLSYVGNELAKVRENPCSFTLRKKFTRMEYLKSPFKTSCDYTAEADGKRIDFDHALIDLRIEKSDGGYRLVMKTVFVSTVKFRKNGTTAVFCSIAQPAQLFSSIIDVKTHGMIINDERTVYRSEYVIGTGGTWKGGIGEFVFVAPRDFSFNEKDVPGLIYAGRYGEYNIYSAREYKPDLDDMIRMEYNSVYAKTVYTPEYYEEARRRNEEETGQPPTEEELARWSDPRNSPSYVEVDRLVSKRIGENLAPQKGVAYIDSSSDVSVELTKYTTDGVISVGSRVTAALDNSSVAGWVTESTGKGEWIDFELSDDAAGFAIQTGYSDVDSDPDFAAKMMEYFSTNQRIEREEREKRQREAMEAAAERNGDSEGEGAPRSDYREEPQDIRCPGTAPLFNAVRQIEIIPSGKMKGTVIDLEPDVHGKSSVRINLTKGKYRMKITEIQDNGTNNAYVGGLEFYFCSHALFERLYDKTKQYIEAVETPDYPKGLQGR
jgi:hypothetical protein